MAHKKSKNDADRYLNKRSGGCFYYQRKVPASVKELDVRYPSFRISLKTKVLSEARSKRDKHEAADEELWGALLSGRAPQGALEAHAAAVRVAEAMGFDYVPAEHLARHASTRELVDRINAMGPATTSVEFEKALLGGVRKPTMTVSAAFDLYLREISSDQLVGKSENQKRKWLNVKKRGVSLFIKVVGDIDMEKIDRSHARKFRQYWQDRIAPAQDGGRPTHTSSSGNRDIGTMHTLYAAYFERIGVHDRQNPFKGLGFKNKADKNQKRPPFTVDHISNVLMKPGALSGLNAEARGILLAAIETGCRPSELANLTADAIKVDHEVPHIVIKPRTDRDNPRELKSLQSRREIPLVGVALEVFRKFPAGFPRYREKEEALSAVVNKYLRENDLMPSPDHTLYGLRHSFEDRMKEAGLGDELRRSVMGHRINREQYGIGGGLEWRRSELKKIALSFDPQIVTLNS